MSRRSGQDTRAGKFPSGLCKTWGWSVGRKFQSLEGYGTTGRIQNSWQEASQRRLQKVFKEHRPWRTFQKARQDMGYQGWKGVVENVPDDLSRSQGHRKGQ